KKLDQALQPQVGEVGKPGTFKFSNALCRQHGRNSFRTREENAEAAEAIQGVQALAIIVWSPLKGVRYYAGWYAFQQKKPRRAQWRGGAGTEKRRPKLTQSVQPVNAL